MYALECICSLATAPAKTGFERVFPLLLIPETLVTSA